MGEQGLWESLTARQVLPDSSLLLLTLAIAFALTLPPAWHWSRNFITVAHEGGHALMAILWGRRLSGIKLNADTSGVTITSGKPYGLGVIFTLLAGYSGPPLMGLGLAWLYAEGRIALSVVLLTVLLGLMFLMIRNLWGFVVVIPAGLAFYYLTSHASSTVQALFLSLVIWFLILGAFRPLMEVQIHRMRGEAQDSDLDQLRRNTLIIPAEVWLVLFVLIAALCAWTSFSLLLLR